jgi:hypothetical protein
MITLFTEDINAISQKIYDNLITSIEFYQLACPCGHSGCLTGHGSYIRYVKWAGAKIKLRISRVLCRICGGTHALLPSSIVPYSQVPLTEQVGIIKHYNSSSGFTRLLDMNPALDEGNVYAVIGRYLKHWRERLFSEGISLSPIIGLIQECFSHFGRQFMQIKKTKNRLYIKPT